jgi:hypothetical protein
MLQMHFESEPEDFEINKEKNKRNKENRKSKRNFRFS